MRGRGEAIEKRVGDKDDTESYLQSLKLTNPPV